MSWDESYPISICSMDPMKSIQQERMFHYQHDFFVKVLEFILETGNDEPSSKKDDVKPLSSDMFLSIDQVG
jgi:hypothetical protein